jgi:hypothetical protein
MHIALHQTIALHQMDADHMISAGGARRNAGRGCPSVLREREHDRPHRRYLQIATEAKNA